MRTTNGRSARNQPQPGKEHRPTRCLVLTDSDWRQGPYGIDLLPQLGYDVFQRNFSARGWPQKLRDVLEHRSHMPLENAMRSLSLATRSDIVLAFLEAQALLASQWSASGIPPYSRRPLVMFACWLADELTRMPKDERRRCVARYRGVDLTMVWSANQVDILTQSGFSVERVEAVPFGMAPELFPYTDPGVRTDRVVAVGFDRGRDYETLMEAVGGTELQVDLYCTQTIADRLDIPQNVSFRGRVPFDEYRDVLRNAGVVAVPTTLMAYPSGQTVALEAGATGACVALSDTPPLREYFSDSTALMIPPGDVNAWRHTLLEAVHNKQSRIDIGEAAARDIHSRFTYQHMWERVDELWRDRGWTRGPSRTSPRD